MPLTSTTWCAAGLGAEGVDSDDVSTDGVYANIRVTADGSGQSVVRVGLMVGGSASNTTLELTEGDRLEAKSGEDAIDLRPSGFLGGTWYVGTHEGDAEGTPFAVAFLREDPEGCHGGSAPDSKGTLPAPFELESPAKTATLSRSNDDLLIRWAPSGSGDQMRWQVRGACVDGRSGTLDADPGEVVIPKGRLVPGEAPEKPECEVTVVVSRVRTGKVDPAYGEGGRFEATQVRTVTFTSTP